MPRTARKYSNIKVYHITIRGIDKQNIFFDNNDRNKFIDIIKESKEKYNYEMNAYCLMDNHVHLVIYDKEKSISKIMQSIEVSYAFYFNKKYERTGHLFQNRFFSKEVEDREYLKMVCRYIHQNPLKAGISKTEEYRWSSYKEYIEDNKFVDVGLLLSAFSSDVDIAKKEFVKFHNIDSDTSNEEKIKNIIEYELRGKMTDKEVEEYVCELLNIYHVREILKYNIDIRNQKLSKLKFLKNIPLTQLARVIGINRKMIERAIRK